MNRSDYERVLTHLCKHLGLSSTALLKAGLLCVGDRNLLLHYDAKHEPNFIQARLDMGVIAPDQEEWLRYRLLVSNFEWGANGTVGWSLLPENDHVILTAQYLFDPHTSGPALAGWLRKVVSCAQAYWQALPSERPVGAIRFLVSLHQPPIQLPVISAEPTRWEQLITMFCDHVGLERESLLSGSDTLAVDGVDMLLRHDQAFPDRFEIRIDLGMETTIKRELLWQGLLWNNFLLGAGGRLLFGVHPHRDAAVLAMQQDLPAELNAADFADLLRAVAKSAKAFWEEASTAAMRMDAALRSETVT